MALHLTGVSPWAHIIPISNSSHCYCEGIWKELFLKKVKHRVTILTSNSTPRYVPKRNENVCPYRDMNMNVYGSIIHKSQKVETTQMPIKRQTDKQIVMYTYNGTSSFSHKKEWSTTQMNPGNIMLSERSQSQKIPYCMIFFIWNVQNKQVYR